MTKGNAVTVHVGSEVGRLRQVPMHRPGLEMRRLTPINKVIAAGLGLARLRVWAADQDPSPAAGGQWDDGCTVLALKRNPLD